MGIQYDYESVMHYQFNAFALNKDEPTIVPKPRHAKIGQNKNLSSLDILRIQKAYKCWHIADPDEEEKGKVTEYWTIKWEMWRCG